MRIGIRHSKMMRQVLPKAGLVLMGIILALMAAEGLLRLLPNSIGTPVGGSFYPQYSPLLGWERIPNAEGKLVLPEFTVSQSFNSRGIRGPEYSYSKGENEYRILVLGDSIAEGYGVEFNELFSEVLKGRLNSTGSEYYYEVITMGMSGYSTDQELLYYQYEGKKYCPDLTILMFHENDVWLNTQSVVPGDFPYNKPLFILKDGELELTNIPVPKFDSTMIHESFIQKVKGWFSGNSYLYNFVARKVTENPFLLSLAVKIGLVEDIYDENGFALVPDYLRVWEKVYSADIGYAWKVTEALVITLRDEAVSIGSKLLVFNVPRKESFYLKDWEDTKKKYGISEKDWNVDQAGVELGALCNRNEIDYINPTEIFQVKADSLALEGKRLYYTYDGHWNATGHQVAGEILAQYILEE